VLVAAAVAAEDPVHFRLSAQPGCPLSQQSHCCSPTTKNKQQKTLGTMMMQQCCHGMKNSFIGSKKGATHLFQVHCTLLKAQSGDTI